MSTFTQNRAAAVALLGEPVRRELYALASADAVSRDEAAERLGIPRSTAAFHLDRLVAAGLLTTESRRLSGRTGPGAGRPAKLYRAVPGDLAGTIPERHYELVGDILAAAAERADLDGIPVRAALAEEAFAAGAVIGARSVTLDEALTSCGYAPVTDAAGDLVLDNCPFHVLAQRHTPLICGANLDFVRGLAHATDDPRDPALAPREGHCCVAVRAPRET